MSPSAEREALVERAAKFEQDYWTDAEDGRTRAEHMADFALAETAELRAQLTAAILETRWTDLYRHQRDDARAENERLAEELSYTQQKLSAAEREMVKQDAALAALGGKQERPPHSVTGAITEKQ